MRLMLPTLLSISMTTAMALSLCLPMAAQADEQKLPVTEDQRNNPRLTDELFVTKAGQANLAEIQFSRKALQKSSSDTVKKFAKHIIDDHTQANAQLKQLADRLKLQMPTELEIRDQTGLSKLDAVEGDLFDEEYAEHMIDGHRRTVALFEAAASADQVAAEVRSFASELLPLLQQHRAEAEKLKEQID